MRPLPPRTLNVILAEARRRELARRALVAVIQQ